MIKTKKCPRSKDPRWERASKGFQTTGKMCGMDAVDKAADGIVKQFHQIAKNWQPTERKALAERIVFLFSHVE